MGALTSKPYAFKGRPWELKTVFSFDFFSELATPLRFDLRNNQIMRILPHITTKSIWINDRVRFSYDSVNIQRSENLFLNLEHPINLKSNWDVVFRALKRTIPGHLSVLKVLPGTFLGLDHLQILKTLASFTGRVFLETNDDDECIDSVNNLFLSETPFSDVSALFLINTDLRFDYPLIYTELLKYTRLSNIKVFSIGLSSRCSFITKQLAIGYYSWSLLITGFHSFWKLIIKESFINQAILVNKQLTNALSNSYSDLTFFLNAFAAANAFKKKGKITYNLLPKTLMTLNSQWLGPRRSRPNIKINQLSLNLSAEVFKNNSKELISINSFDTKLQEKAIFSWPTTLPLEAKTTITSNLFGNLIYAPRAIFPTSGVKDLIQNLIFVQNSFEIHPNFHFSLINFTKVIKGNIFPFNSLYKHEINYYGVGKIFTSSLIFDSNQTDLFFRLSRNLAFSSLRNNNQIKRLF